LGRLASRIVLEGEPTHLPKRYSSLRLSSSWGGEFDEKEDKLEEIDGEEAKQLTGSLIAWEEVKRVLKGVSRRMEAPNEALRIGNLHSSPILLRVHFSI